MLPMRNTSLSMLIILVLNACASLPADVEIVGRDYYLVEAGESFEAVAFRLNSSSAELQLANPWLNPVNISAGMHLNIPPQQNYAHSIGYSDSHVTASSPIAGNRGFIWPLDDIDITSVFGQRHGRLHKGIDLRAPAGTQIRAAAAGRVKFSGRQRGYGNIVIIDHGKGRQTAYAHNRRNLVGVSQRIRKGQAIATVGSSGNATGYHVHFEYRQWGRAVNPRKLFAGL